ncbi:hypothetical protein MPTK1_3g19070 [Marchantia polymorpha subsp. ruderalis]|uniref:Uncharacterized protein n=2 Tax=Marchantia polymorpha TaxID=3197 RepID=A0A176W6P0_MARPO|nr:hypothetical protein AXG93_2351s1130 [Marchantia polymorpha subsp. ruderalis]PTQ38858.1 hypothetical protein MARPO_0049s0125 [Marchantia polymorpha]BBN06179.1 hypothetical protein Mp_3g19070 [Marchantia polymorpha subsp. ruderalis]|eukprot:PTQ38858.1 hypothetical protein MARPO_0049s0125 [Marchantia polymorpha]
MAFAFADMASTERRPESLLSLILAERSEESAHDRAKGAVKTNKSAVALFTDTASPEKKSLAHDRTKGAVKVNKSAVALFTGTASPEKKSLASCGPNPASKLLKKLLLKLESLATIQIYNELDCYRDSHVKVGSEEKRAKAHISLWRSVAPQTHGQISIMERIFGPKACEKMDQFLASDARRLEIKKHEVKMKKGQDFGFHFYPDDTSLWSP